MVISNKYKKTLLVFSIIFVFLFLQVFVMAINEKSKDVFSIWNEKENKEEKSEKKYIKWVENNLTVTVLDKTSKLDIDSHINNFEVKYNWIELISYLACRYGNEFKRFKQKDLDVLTDKLNSGETMENLTKDLEYYNYYLESYTAILEEFIGEYEIEVQNESGQKTFEKRYGLKVYLPIAKNYGFSHYDDFGNSRNYGYKRVHLGNDLMGSVGTPIIAVESGIVEACRVEPIWRMENRD